MTPLHFAGAQGYIDVATALLDAGVDVNQRKGGDRASPLLVATVNGQFDLAGHHCSSAAPIRTWRPRTAWRRSTP